MTRLLLVLAVVGVLVLLVIWSYNRFVAQRAAIAASWAGIDVELQRRHDLVPNLIETVRGYAEHEGRVYREVADARAQAVASRPETVPVRDQARAEDRLTDGVTRLLALTEDHPQLKADARFRDLQRQLVETEDRIAASRRLYNLEVSAYERRRRAVPSNLVAALFTLPSEPLFEIRDAGAQHAALVRF